MLNDDNKTEFQGKLLEWFDQFHRDFPWRETSEPFHILLAEKLLQQTVARHTVVSAYQELIRKYPTPGDLANAEVKDIEKIVQPLGFLYRAKELNVLAQEVVARHNGIIPSNLGNLLALTGVGDYAARAVLTFAFEQDVPIVDTNVARLLHRIYGINELLPANPARKKYLVKLASKLVPPGNSRRYNLAILDLCGLVCKPRIPNCSQCPVRDFCVYGSNTQRRNP